MLTVRDILATKSLEDAVYALDEEVGFETVVRGIGYLDFEPLLDRYHTFRDDEVIITTLAFSGGDVAKATDALIRQMDSGIAAIFIKDYLFDSVDDQTRLKAMETQTPIFFFHRAYTEDAVTELRNIFAADQEAEARRVIVDELRKERDVPQRRALFRDTTGLVGGCTACAAFRPLRSVDPLATNAASATLQDIADREERIGCFITAYEGGWVVLVASDETHESMNALMDALCAKMVSASNVALACGVGNAVALEDVDLSIVQALQAAAFPEAEQVPCRWREAGWAALSGAARESKQLTRQCEYLQGILRTYDQAHHANLLETVRAFVRCDGVVQQTADELFLHPNSVRNRVVKAASLLGLEGEPERSLFAYFTIMFLGER